MLLKDAIDKVRTRLASLDAERAEAEAPLWAAALQEEFPLRPGAVRAQPVPTEIRASCRFDPASWPEYDGQILYNPVQEYGHTTRSFGERMPLPTERPEDKSEGLPDDSALPLDAMTPARQATIIAALEHVGATQPCERCGHSHHELVGEGKLLLGTAHVIPVIYIACPHCGLITEHAAKFLGLV